LIGRFKLTNIIIIIIIIMFASLPE
jgi:hypothetical protein